MTKVIARTAGVLLISILAAALLAACQSGGEKSRTTSGSAPAQRTTTASSVVGGSKGSLASLSPALPLDAYELGNQEEAELEFVDDLLTNRCMQRLGYRYGDGLAQSYVTDEVRISEEIESRTWGVTDLEVARRYGYELPKWAQGASKPILLSSLSADEQRALTGESTHTSSSTDGSHVPAGGCESEGLRIIHQYGLSLVPTSAQRLAGNLTRQAFLEAEASGSVQHAFQRWSACMASHGFRYATPFAAAAGFTDTRSAVVGHAPAPGQVQIDAAVSDVRCKARTGLLRVAYGAMSDIERKLIEQNAQPLSLAAAQVGAEGRALAKLAIRYGLP